MVTILPKLWFQKVNLSGPIRKLDHHQRSDLIQHIKSLKLLNNPNYLDDIVRIISETAVEPPEYSANSSSLFFVMNQFSDTTLTLLHRYVRAVYKHNNDKLKNNTNKSFNQLLQKISNELDTENSAAVNSSTAKNLVDSD